MFGWVGGLYWKDVNRGKVIIKEGVISKKERQSMKSGLKQLKTTYLYWVIINGKRLSISEEQFEAIAEGDTVRVRQAPSSKFILEIE